MTAHRDIRLYEYWRSSASYRVRIALKLLGLNYASVVVDIPAGQQRGPEHLKRNPQGLLPVLDIDGQRVTQSLAIIEYLQATTPGASLIPADPKSAALVRQLSYVIAMEIHPICNPSVAGHVADLAGGGEETRVTWMKFYIDKGLAAFEALLPKHSGRFAVSDAPTMADCCLVPQLYNARRWGIEYSHLTRISQIETAALKHPAFAPAKPDAAPGNEK